MAKVLIGDHAEDVGGGRVIEPGSELPDGVDPDVLKRLEQAGRLADTSRSRKSKSDKED